MLQGEQAVCLICATPLQEGLPPHYYFPDDFDHTVRDPSKWGDQILLCGPTWPDYGNGPPSMSIHDENVTIHEARITGTKQASISTGLDVFMQTEYIHDTRDDRMWWFLPLHPSCLAMARKVMAAPGSKITSLGDLWMTLERRCKKEIPHGWSPGFCIPAIPNNRPGEPIELGLGRYYIPPQWTYDPLEVPDLTESLMSTLERAESPLADEGFSNRFDSLPPEIRNIIIEDLIDCILTEGGSSLECTYLIPQYRWKQALTQIPFLWDLENEIVERKDQEAATGLFEWNWEKLARQMSEYSIFREGDEYRFGFFEITDLDTFGLSVPPALANRIRIWQILTDMYPNDVGMVNAMDREDEGSQGDEEDEDSESESILHDYDLVQ